jgi:hypothetical protein
MTLETETADIVGPFRTPHNSAQSQKGSIHDDATASKLGFKGGTVAGSLHMDQFAPLVVQLYGEDWWKHGNLSCYFRQATVDRETVRAFARAGEPHARLWMENEAGALIAEGTASCAGSDTDTAVQRLMQSQAIAEPSALRILANVKPGDEVTGIEASISREALDRRLESITETLPVYLGEHGVAPPSMNVPLFRGSIQEKLYRTDGGAVGLFGAIELQSINGPLRTDTPYKLRAKVLALSESPKTENVWYRAWAADPQTGEDVSSMLMYLRYMKASSKHYAG